MKKSEMNEKYETPYLEQSSFEIKNAFLGGSPGGGGGEGGEGNEGNE